LALVVGGAVDGVVARVVAAGARVVDGFDDTLVPPDEWQAVTAAAAASTRPARARILRRRSGHMASPLSITRSTLWLWIPTIGGDRRIPRRYAVVTPPSPNPDRSE